MRSGVIVVGDEGFEGFGALGIGDVRALIGPLPLERLDEGLGFAVGLRTKGPGLLQLDSVMVGDLDEKSRAVAFRVVGEHAVHADPPFGECEDHALKETSGGSGFLVWQ